jgi:GntR family transcriptional regulator
VQQRHGLRYLTVKDHILEEIARRSPGAPIPPERDLAAAYGASRTTVRKAVTELVGEGRLLRRQGSGTYVASPKLAWPLTVSDSIAPHGTGVSESAMLLSATRDPASPELASRLGIAPGGQVLSMELLRSVDDTPMAISRAQVSARRYPGLAAAVARTGSVYEALRGKFDVRVTHAVGTIETAPAGPHEAALLGTDTGAPMLLVSRLGHTEHGEPVEWVETRYRGDRASFVTHLS